MGAVAERRIMEVNNQFNQNFYPGYQSGTDKKPESVAEEFKAIKEAMMEARKLTPENIKREDDWRKMTDAQWDKLMSHIDEYLDDCKEDMERLQEIQKEAADKAVALAPAEQRAAAASRAMLKVMANGTAGEENNDASDLEKMSWTYEMKTDDQGILGTAKLANEYAADMMAKAQEIAQRKDVAPDTSMTLQDIWKKQGHRNRVDG